MIKIVICALFICNLFYDVQGAPDCSKPPGMHNLKCCKIPDINKDDLIPESCASYKVDKASANRGPMGHACLIECILNATGILDDGKINVEKAQEKIENIGKDYPDFIPVMKKAVETCNAKAPEFKEKPNRNGPEDCSAFSAFVVGCTMRETYFNCPSSKWTDTDECNNTREFMRACPMGQHRGGQHQ